MKHNLIETIPYNGYEIEVFYDTDAQSPDELENDDAFIVYDHRDFFIKRKGFDPNEIFETWQSKNIYDGYHIFPLYAYIHSGVSLSLGRDSYPFTCRWDTSFKGFVLVKKQKGWTWTREKGRKVADSIVEEWNMYLSGDVYGYHSEAGSCWGFYGKEGMKEMIEQAKGEIEYEIAKKRKEHFKRLKTWILNKVPLSKRQSLAF